MTKAECQDSDNCALCAEHVAEIERLEIWISDLQSEMFINCVYCGHNYGPDDEVPATMAEVLKEHIAQCPKHPMSALTATNRVLCEKLEFARVALRKEVKARPGDPIALSALEKIEDKPRWSTQAVCTECKTHHPNGWACPKELAALREKLREQAETLERANTLVRASRREGNALREKLEKAGEVCSVYGDHKRTCPLWETPGQEWTCSCGWREVILGPGWRILREIENTAAPGGTPK